MAIVLPGADWGGGGGGSHPSWLQVSFSGGEMKGDGFLVVCCAFIYSTLHLYPRVNEDSNVCMMLQTQEAGMQICTALGGA